MSNRITYIVAACFLTFVFLITLFSMSGDSLTMDELAHLPAGYSYLTQRDMRLNPEHPPLIKDLAAFPLLFIKGIHFPSDIKSWKEDLNGQWEFGNNFLFKSGNPADEMIFWGRIPMILVLLLLGFLVFKWTRELFGNKTALFALFMFSFSPILLAHGRLVTTDVGAAMGFFVAIYYFIKALQSPSKKNIIIAGVAFGIAELLKFTLIILMPFLGFLAFVWWLFVSKKLIQTIKITIFVFVIGVIIIWPVYQYHVWNYPVERQVSDTTQLLTSHPFAKFLIPALGWMAEKPVLRAYAQYLLGLSLVYQRGTGGNTTYFMGEVSATGWKDYFPIVYIIKEPLAFHFLTLIAILYAIWLIKKPWQNTFLRLKDWIKSHFPEFSMICFILFYWAFSLMGNLNIGLRHLLPIFPFIFVLVSAMIVKWISSSSSKLKYSIIGILILWQTISVISVYPSFLAYFNELADGPDGGYRYVTDSNLDWGQDLKRLVKWTNENGVDKIYIEYFGGADAQYYLKNKYASWWRDKDPKKLPKGSYLAVSATPLQGGRGKPAPGFDQPFGYYNWLNNYTPVAKIGYSIFVYKID